MNNRFTQRWTKTAATACAFACAAAAPLSLQAEDDTAERAKKGAAIYAQNCSACHGPRMRDPQGAFDLQQFPKNERDRFITSVAKGRNQMPPWGGLLSAEEIDMLWLYVRVGDQE